MTEIVIELMQPATFGDRSADDINVVSTVGFAPGAAVRGAVASAWIRSFGPPQKASADRRSTFESLFERSHLWGPMMVDGTNVVPTYVGRCKYPKGERCHAVVVDRSVGETATRCPECDDSLEWGKGQVAASETVRSSSTQLDDDETASDGRLFSRDYLPKGKQLRGYVSASPGDLDWLTDAVLWLGARSSVAGMARVISLVDERTDPVVVTDRRVIVRAVSPLVICDEFGRSDPFMALRALAAALDLCPDDYDQIQGSQDWLRVARTSGWNALGGCPKPDEWTVAPGSAVGLLLREHVNVASVELAAGRLREVGLGLRRHEGFGCVVVNPPKWQPPVADAPTRALATAPVDAFEMPDFDDDQRRGLEPAFRTRIEQLEANERATPTPLGRSVVRGLSDAQRTWLEQAIASGDVENLRRIHHRLQRVENPGGFR